MIAIGNNEWSTLNDGIYVGATQIAKVYRGATLIYPDSDIITIDDLEIDTNPYYLNGRMYDTGYAPTKNTRFEICLTVHGVGTNAEFFGTHHDNLVTPEYTNNLNNDGSKGTAIGAGSTPTSNPNVGNYVNKTKFHILFDRTSNFMSFRYGCQQDSGTAGEHNLAMPANDRFLFATFDDEDKFYSGYDKGPYYYTSRGETISYSGSKESISQSDYSENGTGGNIWINGVNSKTLTPNRNRPYSVDTNNNIKYDDDDIIFYHPTSSSAFHYLILWEKNDPSSKVIYVQKRQTLNNQQIVVFEKHTSSLGVDNNYHFNQAVAATIYPFKYCEPTA